MNIIQIQYFIEACRTKNFTKAAANMYTSQPSLSRQISLLEDEIGGPLLIRNNRKVEITELGQSFFMEVYPIMEQLKEAYYSVKKQAKKKKEIRIGTFRPIELPTVAPMFEKMREYFEGYRLVLSHGNSRELMEQLENRELDVAICINYRDYDIKKVARCVFAKHPAVAFATKDFDGPFDQEHIKESLNGKKLICMNGDKVPGHRECYERICEKLGVKPGCVVETSAIISELEINERAEGFSFTLNSREHMKRDNLLSCQLPKNVFEFEILIYWRTDAQADLNDFFKKTYMRDI